MTGNHGGGRASPAHSRFPAGVRTTASVVFMETEDLILLPGLLCDARLWEHQRNTLCDIARVTVADLTRFDRIETMAEAVLAEAPARFALAGLSMGGYVAQEIMRRAPERVSRLALCNTNARADTPEESTRRCILIAQARNGRFRGVTPRLLPLIIHPDRLDDHSLVQTITTMAERVGREAFIRQQTAIIHRRDGEADLARVVCPTLVLCGRQDALTPWQAHAAMAAVLPHARLVIIEDVGHLPPLERPQAVSALFRYWLQERS